MIRGRRSRPVFGPAVAALVLLASPGGVACAGEVETVRPEATPARPAAELRSIVSGGVRREFRIFVPATARSGLRPPVVMLLHGALGDSAQVERWTGLATVAEREGFVAVYPQGLDGAWNDGRPPELRFRAARGATRDDARFLRDLASHLVAAGSAAPGRIFLAGISNGGYMAARMICEAAELFAGFAILIASAPRSYRRDCRPARAVPILLLSGTEDRLVPWEGYVPDGLSRDGEVGILSATDHAAHWAERNGCTGSSEIRLHDTDPADGSVILRRDWAGCAKGGAVTHYVVEGGGHQTPSLRTGVMDQVVAAFLGPRNRDAETAELVWEFFRRVPAPAGR